MVLLLVFSQVAILYARNAPGTFVPYVGKYDNPFLYSNDYYTTTIKPYGDLTAYCLTSGDNSESTGQPGLASGAVFTYTPVAEYKYLAIHFSGEIITRQGGHKDPYQYIKIIDANNDTLPCSISVDSIYTYEPHGYIGIGPYIDPKGEGDDLTIYRLDTTLLLVDVSAYVGTTLTIKMATACCSNVRCHSSFFVAFEEFDPKLKTFCQQSDILLSTIKHAPVYEWRKGSMTSAIVGSKYNYEVASSEDVNVWYCTIKTRCDETTLAFAGERNILDYDLDVGCDGVTFSNKSYIQYWEDGEIKQRKPDAIEWDLGDGSYTTQYVPDYKVYNEGNYTVSLKLGNKDWSCDTSDQRSFTIVRNQYLSLYDTICEQELPYTWRKKECLKSGVYIDTIALTSGCDSIYILHLDVLPTTRIDTTLNVCEKEFPFVWKGTTITSEGDYSITTQSLDACDSIFTLHVKKLNPTTFVGTYIKCKGYVLRVGELTFTSAGTYKETLVNAAGCDSIVTITITEKDCSTPGEWGDHPLNPTVPCDTAYSTLDTTIYCDSLLWFDKWYYTSGTYHDTLPGAAANLCDSVGVLNLEVIDNSTSSDTTAYTCYGVPFIWHGKEAEDGDTIRRKNVAGCDSIVTLRLFVSETPVTIPLKDTASCLMVPFMWRGHTIVSDTICYDTLRTTMLGCDSIYASLRFVVKEPSESDTSAYVCYEDLPFIWHGKPAMDGDTIVLTNAVGCDSIVTLKLITLSADTTTNTASICAGSTYTWKREGLPDRVISIPGDYADTVRYIETGCDSMIYRLTLTIDDINRDSIAQSTCQGTPYFWRGQDRYIDSVYRDTARARTASECDTVYVLKLTINLPTAGDTTAYTCYGVPFIWHGKPAVDGDTIMRKNAVGCDSIVTLKLFVSEAPVTIPLKDTASCQMIPFIWRGHTIVSDTLCYDTIRTTKLGCDSIYASLRFVVKEPSISDTTAYVCYEDLPFIWHGKVAQNGDTIVRKNIVGCDSIVTLHLTVSPVMQTISKDTTVCDTVLPITWHGFEFNSVLIYRDTLLNTHGCDSLERIYTVNVIHCEPPVPPVPPTPTDTCLDSLVYKKWQDVIFCDNGRHEFVAFQWFKDNTLMQGETKQYYFHEGGMGPSEYFVEVTYRDGRKRRTCPITFDETPRSADTYVKVQTLVRRGDNLHIQMTDDVADISIYTVVGQSVMATSVQGPLVELPLPLPTGVYILLLHASNIDTTTKIIIE